MAKLFSCFGQRKKTKNSCDTTNKTARRSRRPSNETNQVVYVVNTGAENPLRYSGNLTSVYRTETIPQTPQYEKNFQADGNRHSKSYPVSPERRSLYKVYSYEQRPSFEKQRLSKVSRRDSRDSRNIKVYAANVSPVPLQYNKSTNISIDSFPFEVPIDNVPRRSTLSHGVDYEKELQISKESPKCVAEKPAEDMEPGTSKDKPVSSPVTARDDTRNMQEIEKQGTFLRTNAIDKSNFSPQSSSIRSQNIMYLVTENVAEPKIKSVVRASKDFALGRSVKTMIYRAEDLNRPMSANKYVHQMPIKANKHNTLTTSDGKILKPLTSDNVRRLSTSSGKNKQIRLSLVKPVEDVEGFPLAHGGEVIVAAPMIGGGGGVRKGGKPQKPKPILRKGGAGRGAGPAMRGPPPMDDYDDFPYEGDYGRGGYSYYDDVSDMFAPVDDRYSAYGGGYYDDGYGYGYPEEDMGRYGRGPAFRGARPRQQVYAAQMPDITLPGSSVDKGKNPPFKKIGKQADKLESCIDTEYYNLKSEKEEKEHKVKMISSAQQTDLPNELDFICFSPDKCFKTSEAPDDPNSKLRSGLFGPRKKKKKQSALQERNIVIYQITESPCSINGNQEFSFQNTDYDANQRSENYQRSSFAVPNVPASPKDNLYNNNSEDRMTHILGNTDRLSFPGNVEQTGKRKFTVLVPLSETEGPGSNKKRMPHILESIEGVEVQPRKLSRIGGSPETVRSLLGNPNEINQTRQSAICPTRRMSQPRVERLSTVHPTEINIQSERFSRVEPPSRTAEPFINSIQFIEGFGPKVQTRKLSQIEESPETVRLKSLNLKDVGPSRPSTQYPVMGMSQDQPRVVRLSTVQPMNAGINTQSGRLSKVKLLTGTEEFPLNTTQQPVVYTVRRSVSKPANRHSFSLKKLFSRKRKEEEDDKGSADSLMEQTVYAVPTVPTRGRTRSILQQSVKTLTSQKEEAPVAWKNIRYSVDTDVFSADVKRKNEKPLSPGYVNMERGQGMLVSELLNPITSIFVSDLKDPVPKDPLTKPREFNNWVRPRQGSMRQVVTPQQPVRVKVAVAPAQTNASKIQSRSKYRQKYSDSEDEESSDSYSENESMEFYNPRSKYSKPRRQYHRVYAATMPGVVLPEMRTGMKVSFLDTKPSTSISKTLILSDVKPEMEEKKNSDVVTTLASPSPSKDSLNSSGEEIRVSKLVQPPNVKRLSLAEQFDIEDAVDFLCRPPDGLNDTTSTLGSGSKLLLQMMMEKEE